MVSDGLTPTLAGIDAPSTTYRPGWPNTWCERWLDAVSEWMRAYEGLAGSLSVAHRNQASPLAPTCQQVIAATDTFLEAAQRDGHARPGVSARDLFMVTLAVTWVTHSAADSDGAESGVRDILRSGWAISCVGS